MSQRKVKAPVKVKNPETVPFDMDAYRQAKAAGIEFSEAQLLLTRLKTLHIELLETRGVVRDLLYGGSATRSKRSIPPGFEKILDDEDDGLANLFDSVSSSWYAVTQLVQNRILQLL